jgi:hypothetical protein
MDFQARNRIRRFGLRTSGSGQRSVAKSCEQGMNLKGP